MKTSSIDVILIGNGLDYFNPKMHNKKVEWANVYVQITPHIMQELVEYIDFFMYNLYNNKNLLKQIKN